MTLATFLNSATTVVTWLFNTVFGAIVTAITGNPITLAFVIVSLIGVVSMLILDILLTAVGQ